MIERRRKESHDTYKQRKLLGKKCKYSNNFNLSHFTLQVFNLFKMESVTSVFSSLAHRPSPHFFLMFACMQSRVRESVWRERAGAGSSDETHSSEVLPPAVQIRRLGGVGKPIGGENRWQTFKQKVY